METSVANHSKDFKCLKCGLLYPLWFESGEKDVCRDCEEKK